MKNRIVLIALVFAVAAVFALKARQENGVRSPEAGALAAPPAAVSPGRSQPAAPIGETILPPGYAAGVPRLVSLGSGSCIPCKKMEPVRQALRSEYAGQLLVDFIDVWDHPEAGRAYGIRLIPTLVVYDAAGRELGRHEGYISKEDLLPILKRWGVALTPVTT